jgi:WD40 repeat protein
VRGLVLAMLSSNGNGSRRGANQSRTGRLVSLLVSTSHPTPSVSSTSTGGALSLICPTTGAVQNSTRIQGGDLQHTSNKGQVGVSHISLFPRHLADAGSSASLAIAYGSSTIKKRGNDADDSHAMLFTVRRTAAAAPILHWKCRLPEPNMTGGLLVSTVTSRHIVGGGATGTLYVWDILQGGNLVRTISSAHCRAVTCMIWSAVDTTVTTSPWDAMLCTGGADGIVHVFSHVDLVEQSSPSYGNANNSVHPIRTWSKHHLKVTALVAMSGGRIASASEDGQIIVMGLCSGSVVATFQLPEGIRALCTDSHHGRRLFAGGSKGNIHIVDLDCYSLHCTVQMGSTVIRTPRDRPLVATLEDRVFGSSEMPGSTATSGCMDSASVSYKVELRGHDHAVTSLAVYDDANDNSTSSAEYAVSGDESGVVRVWDSRRACCIRVINVWASPSSADINVDAKEAKSIVGTARWHPVTSITILRDVSNPFDADTGTEIGGMLGNTHINKRRKTGDTFLGLMSPLQKFASVRGNGDLSSPLVPIPFIEPQRNDTLDWWDISDGPTAIQRALRMRQDQRHSDTQRAHVRPTETGDVPADATVELLQKSEEVSSLQKELDLAKETIARWEVVNNKLMMKLQQESQRR